MSRRIVPLLPPSLSTTPRGAYYLTDAQIALIGNDIRETSGGRVYAKARASLLPQDRRQGTRDLSSNGIIDLDPNDWIYLVKENGKWRTANSSMIPDLTSLWPTLKSNPESDRILDEILQEVVVTPEKNGTDNYGDNLSTWGNGPAVSAYDPNSELVRPNIERLLYLDPVNKQIRDKQLSERLSSYTPYNFLSTIIPAHLADPMNYLGAAGEYFRGNDNFFLNALSGNNNGIFSLSQDLENWSKEHPNWATAANLAGSAITGKFMLKIPKLFPKVKGAFNTGLNKFSTGLDRAGSWNVKASDWATRSTSALGNRAVSAIESVPGGSSITGLGRGALNTGRSALSNVGNYGNQLLQRYIPQRVRQWSSNAFDKARDVTTSFKLENLIDSGLQRINNGVGLSDLGKLGVKLGKTAWGVGSTIYGLGTGDESADWTTLGNATKYIPGLTPLYSVSNVYNKYKGLLNAFDNTEKMFNEGVTSENALNVVKGTIDALSKNS